MTEEPPTWRPPAGDPDPWRSSPAAAAPTPPPPPSPYPYYAAPPSGPPPFVPPRKSRLGLGIGLAVGGVLLVCAVCIGVLAAAGGFTYLGYRLDRADAVAALRAYLEEVKAENYAAAYDRLCDRAKEGVSRAEFGEQFPPPRMASFRIGDVSMADRDGESGYHVEVELRLDDGTTVTDTYFVFSRTDDLDRYYICPPDS